MKSPGRLKIQEVIAAHPDDVRLLQEAGILEPSAVQAIKEQQVFASLSSKYYDLNKVRTDVLTELGDYQLVDLEFEPGRYEYAYDYLGTLETACRTFGLAELGIEETDDGYKLGEAVAGSLDDLDGAEAALESYAATVAKDLTANVKLPGAFYFGFNSEFGDGAYRLFYAFEDADIPELQQMGCKIESPAQEAAEPELQTAPQLEASFEEILAALEEEGCHEIARKLHSILREH